jgi:uroporphyrinogen-III synthase
VLPGTTVVLTRPVQQARATANLIEANGGRAVLFPALEISRHTPEPDAREALANADIAIFISANSVEFGLHYAQGKLPSNLQLAAIGNATAQALKNQGYNNIIVPESGADSEALLATAALQAVAGKQIVIFRGVGGRETLRKVLCQRGAKVAYIECYMRRTPDISARAVADLMQHKDIAALHILSRETLENFCTMIGPENAATLRHKALFVPHSAVLEGARMLGFSDVAVTGFGDEGLIAALQQRFGNPANP